MDERNRKEQQVISYLHLRMLIGACGIVLPLTCLIYGLICGMQDSISDFYYTGVRNIFVGILFVLGFFLLTYKGYERKDSIIANFGFVFSLGVALFPCRGSLSALHFISAFLLFSVFIFFSLRLFTLSLKMGERTAEREQAHKIYVTCGWIMVACILLIGVTLLPSLEEIRITYNSTFWFETVALIAFAVSWLTKGKFYSEALKVTKRITFRKTKMKTESN